MKFPPPQFSIQDLLVLTAATAVFLVLGKHSRLAAMISFPLLVGGFAGHWKAQSVKGALAGSLVAFHAYLLLGLPASVAIALAVHTLEFDGIVSIFSGMAIAVVFSVVGGYAGGAIEKRHREGRRRAANETSEQHDAA